MIRGIAVLLLFQLLGESLVFLTGLAVPGPVVGLTLLLLALPAAKRYSPDTFAHVDRTAEALLANLGLLFIPAGVGVVGLWGIVGSQSLSIGVVLVVSAVLTLAVTVWTFILTSRLFRQDRGPR